MLKIRIDIRNNLKPYNNKKDENSIYMYICTLLETVKCTFEILNAISKK